MPFLTKNPANILTVIRMGTSVAIGFCQPFAPMFYAWYLAGGASDILDGYIARKTGSETMTGEILDSIADGLFVGICLWKLLPEINLPVWLLLWMGGIALVRIGNLISGWILQKRLVMLHTKLNKLTGFCLFLFPLTIPIAEIRYSAVPLCLLATIASVQEGHWIRTGRKP